MTPTWTSPTPPDPWKLTFSGAILVILRGVPLILVIFGGLVVLLCLRLIEWPLFGAARPWTPHITVWVCRVALRLFGLRVQTIGIPMAHHGAIVANHSSWLDIFVLNAGAPLYFVAKSEVAGWAGIGWLARATGTVFVRRARSEARAQKDTFETRLLAGHRLLFFPEGTSTDGQEVLSFKPTLFAAFLSVTLRKDVWVQPVSVRYCAGTDNLPRHYAWWGDMEFAGHLLKILATPRQGSVHIAWHEPVQVAEFTDRKVLARRCEQAVRTGHEAAHAP